MLIKTLTVGQMEENSYVVTDEDSLLCAVIDPGDESNTILDYIEENHLTPVAILLTHGHFDHTGAVEAIHEETGAPVYISKDDTSEQYEDFRWKPIEGTRYIADGQIIEVGKLRFRVLETPGHSKGSVTFRCEDALFTGDTLFRGSAGRTDLPGGDYDRLMASLRRLADIPGDLEIYPGHEAPSTLNVERATNYYMRLSKE
ncbi:MAG: MBL fold metallo-hydrolase [Oscillospiraceae bacterium]|nr:MBL fold metallo-hydrolase [Oscillospiraceae bacterium]